VTARPDPSSATSLDLIAHGTGRPTSLANLANGSGVNFIVDGNVITGHNGSAPAPFLFNANGYASDIITGLTPGTHTVTAELTDSFDNPLNPLVGYKVGVNTVTATTGQGS
jgi:hypothetical protein